MAVVSEQLISQFEADGVVKIPGLVDPDRLAAIHGVAERELAIPGEWTSDTNPGATTNRLFTTRYLWQHDQAINDFVYHSGVAEVAATLMQSTTARFYFDHLLVKEPQTSAPTPWHQDIPYWPFLGKQIASVWVSLTKTTVDQSSLEFVRGSHRWDSYFAPVNFDAAVEDWTADFVGEQCPDIEANRADYDIVGFDVEPGDALVFSAWIVHGSPANRWAERRAALSTRWLGDDTTWAPHPGSDPTDHEGNLSADVGVSGGRSPPTTGVESLAA
ncbi:MAG: phytanoyl-CoA dioxygenase family protein [Acidimicrobiales bacterium]